MSTSFTLLWVEDEADDVFLGERALVKAGFAKPMIVRDGEQAVDYLSGNGDYSDRARFPLPSLVLLDLKLPRISGFEVLKWIRQHEAVRRIPVIILSSSREQQDITLAYDFGANAFLVKPVDTQMFSALFRSLQSFWAGFNMNSDATPEAVRQFSGGWRNPQEE